MSTATTGAKAGPPPPPTEPSVSIVPPTGPVIAGAPTTIVVSADAGVQWVYLPGDDSYNDEPMVTYTETVVTIPNVEEIRDHTGGGGTYRITYPRPGTYTVSAYARTSTGGQVDADPVTVHVTAAGPPVFGWTAPADGTVLNVGPGGAQLDVRLNAGTDQYFPLNVAVSVDGVTITAPYGGGDYVRTVGLAPTPLGARSISVTCTDPDGRGTTQTRTIIAHDGTPPTVTLDPFDPSVAVTSLPFTFVVTGTTPGAASGVTGVRYTVDSGPSGAATNTAANGDFSTWRAAIDLPTTGTFTFTITATDSRGGTSSGSGTVSLHF